MPKRASEAAFFVSRIELSTAKALASADSCARASHIGMAEAYIERLADLRRSTLPTAGQWPARGGPTSGTGSPAVGALARWDNEGGAVEEFTAAV